MTDMKRGVFQPFSRNQYPYAASVMVPPTPPATLSTLTIAPSGICGNSPAMISPRLGAVKAAAISTVTNIRMTKPVRTFSNRS